MLSENVRMALLVIDDWEVSTALLWAFAEVLMGFIYSKDTTEQSICFDDRGFWRFVLFFNFRDFLPFCGPPHMWWLSEMNITLIFIKVQWNLHWEK